TVSLVRRHPNVLVQRTFSKDHALAGLRIGYGIAHPDVINAFELLKSPFNVNAAALAAMRGALESMPWQEMGVNSVLRERKIFMRFLQDHGVDYFPSQANFVTARLNWKTIEAPVHA